MITSMSLVLVNIVLCILGAGLQLTQCRSVPRLDNLWICLLQRYRKIRLRTSIAALGKKESFLFCLRLLLENHWSLGRRSRLKGEEWREGKRAPKTTGKAIKSTTEGAAETSKGARSKQQLSRARKFLYNSRDGFD